MHCKRNCIGHRSRPLSEVQRYTKAADRKRMAREDDLHFLPAKAQASR